MVRATAAAANFNPLALVWMQQANIYVSDYGDTIRKVNTLPV
jgi:hypothetical protein